MVSNKISFNNIEIKFLAKSRFICLVKLVKECWAILWHIKDIMQCQCMLACLTCPNTANEAVSF